jgi:hypothetical protein
VKREFAKQQEVLLTTIDTFCVSRGIKTIDLLKIDTEGTEFEVLLGAKAMLESQRITAIQFEFGETYIGSGLNFKWFWDRLSPDYRIFRVLTRGLFEMKEYSFDHEIMKIANYVAVLKSRIGGSRSNADAA